MNPPPIIPLRKKRLLVACEYSGVVRDAFAELGWDAWSCDLLPSESPGNHYQGDVRDILTQQWDLLIAHPTCRYLANSGVSHRDSYEQREEMRKGIEFFLLFLNAMVPHICVENPIMHGYAKSVIGEQTQLIQPWMFGEAKSKATCLWLRNLPPLEPTANVKSSCEFLPVAEVQECHYMPKKDRAKRRAKTYAGIAQAMAHQWTSFLYDNPTH